METKPESPLDRAIRLGGGVTKLARDLSLSGHAVIYQWERTRVPAHHCLSIERLTGVRCEELRPDLEWSVLINRPRPRKRRVTKVEVA